MYPPVGANTPRPNPWCANTEDEQVRRASNMIHARWSIRPRKIVAVEPYRVAFVDGYGHARTAFLSERADGWVMDTVVDGWPVD